MSLAKLPANLRSVLDYLDENTLGSLQALAEGAEQRQLARGEILVRQGESPDALYFVLSGRFSVHLAGRTEPIGEIGQGQPIGEIGFFAGMPRTATVKAMRDSRVLVITREHYRQMSESSREIQDAVIVALARRLSGLIDGVGKAQNIVRTIALVWAGGSRPSSQFIDLLRNVFGAARRTIFLSRDEIAAKFANASLEDSMISDWLNSLEAESDFVFYIADPDLTDWTKKCIRQADAILLVARAGAPVELNSAEQFAFSIHAHSVRRLAILHDARTPIASGTPYWLAARDVLMHHHVALVDDADVRRLFRFFTGQALGFVAGGGGVRGSAHLGVYKAFCEAGAEFDILGGTSSGAAMAAALAYGVDPERVDEGTHNIFVKRRAFRRPTFPRYGLIDHKVFDAALKAEYGDTLIEDLWRPYFAVSSNLSDHMPRIHRRGLVWHAVRASGSIPAVLPPFFTKEGEMLVDGALVDNIPLGQMKAMKIGPNVVVAPGLESPTSYAVDYEAIPGAFELIGAMLNPFSRRRLPQVPSMLQVIMLSMLADHRPEPLLNETDILIRPELPDDVRFTNWERHSEVFMKSYHGVASWIQARVAANDSRVLAVIGKALPQRRP